MELVVDYGDVVLPSSAAEALQRAVQGAVASEDDAIAKLELRVIHLSASTRPWLCAARARFRDGRVAAVEVRGVSPTSAALAAVHALAMPLRRTG